MSIAQAITYLNAAKSAAQATPPNWVSMESNANYAADELRGVSGAGDMLALILTLIDAINKQIETINNIIAQINSILEQLEQFEEGPP